MPESVFETIRKAELVYLYNKSVLSKYVYWSMFDTVERIDAYLNSKHISGETDSLGREKPFFNIVTAASNIWYRATQIETKDIRFVAKTNTSVLLAFVVNIMLQNWMEDYGFERYLSTWGRTLARYGSAVTKSVEKTGSLVIQVVPWNRFIPDPIQFEAIPRIEKFYRTPAQLRKNKLYDQEVVSQLILAHSTRKTLLKQPKNQLNDFIEIYEVHGELDSRLLDDKPQLVKDQSQITYVQQMHAVSYIQNGKDKYQDFALYKGREAHDIYQKDDLIEEDGRTLGIGAVEHLFDAQWQVNHSVKNMKDTLDFASKLIMQTNDPQFVNRNVLTAIETGDILVYGQDKQPLTRVANDSPSIVALMNYREQWENLAQEITATPDALRGKTPPSGTPYGTTSLIAEQSQSLFEVMVDNKAIALQDILKRFVIPYIKKQLKNTKQVARILDDAGISQIDAMYIPHEAIKRYNKHALDAISKGQIPSPYNQQQMQGQVQSELAAAGNQRFFVPDDIDSKTWDDILSDFEWDSIRIEIGTTNVNKQAILDTLSSVLQTVASNPTILQNQNAMTIFSAILRETNAISPMQLSANANIPQPVVRPNVRENIDFKDLPPEAQQQVLAKMGITMTLPPTAGAATPNSTPVMPKVGGV